jgi:hypothetical protein
LNIDYDRLFLTVNIDPNLELNREFILDKQLQQRMKKLGVPYHENVRLILLDLFIDVFNFDQDTRKKFQELKDLIKGALNSKSPTCKGNLEKLYDLYYKELGFLTKEHSDLGVGWRLLKNLPF